MGKSSSKPKIELTDYFMSLHLGVCAGPVTLLAITIKEKSAWAGTATDLTSFAINQPGLFGGNKKEGGAVGTVHWLPGSDDQVLPDALAVRLGRANGLDCPGFRGLASLFFVGSSQAGFYWTSNQPYLPGVWATVKRAPVGLNSAYAMVPRIGSDSITVLLPRHSSNWKYLTEPYNTVGSDYSAADYDDSGWAVGPAPFYTGQPHPHTEINTWGYGSGTDILVRQDVWMRRVLSVPAGATLLIAAAFDNNVSVWVDGQSVEMTAVGAWTAIGSAVAASSSVVVAVRVDEISSAVTPNWTFADIEITTAAQGEDANPAHTIYECLTDTDWGMGASSTAIDVDSFEAAGVTLYGEGFGLSMMWVRQSSIQDFIQEVLDHIQGVLFVDPSTGLLTLKLIRGDYNPDTLPELTPDNAELGNFSRKLWGEITNEIIVTWTNPANEQEETVTVQDLASIATQGGIVSDGRNYYGVRSAILAQRLAQRDLRSSGAPLARCDVVMDRTMWETRPASVLRVTWPEHGLAGVVMRVVEVDYGRPGDMTIKASLIEDVFGLDAGDYVEPPSTGWVDPAEPPEPVDEQVAFTLPYFMAANSSVAAFVDDPAYPEVVAGILATTTQEDAYAYDLWSEVTLPNGDLEWQQISTANFMGHAELVDALVPEASTADVTFDGLTGSTQPTLAGLVLIGTDEAESEIAMIDAVGATYTLTRGVLDTVPRAWPAGTPVWFIDDAALLEDPLIRAAGEAPSYKLLTRTSRGVLDIGDAVELSDTLSERPWLPSRPANVQVDGVLFNDVTTPVDMMDRADPWVTVSWANRNRITEDSQILAWTDSTVTPEDGQTTGIEVIADDGVTVLDTITGLSGTSHDVPDASFGSESVVLIRPFAERSDADGDFVSLQAHGIWVQVRAIAGPRITETGDSRITEDGDTRVTET